MATFVETRSSRFKKTAKDSHECVVFESYKPKAKRNALSEASEVKTHNPAKEQKDLEMKKVRYDIIKYASAGLQSTEKEDAKVALAVSLGAKPPKRKYKNYKEILANKKKEREIAVKSQKSSSSDGQRKVLNKKSKFRSRPVKKNVSGLLDIYGKVIKNRKV